MLILPTRTGRRASQDSGRHVTARTVATVDQPRPLPSTLPPGAGERAAAAAARAAQAFVQVNKTPMGVKKAAETTDRATDAAESAEVELAPSSEHGSKAEGDVTGGVEGGLVVSADSLVDEAEGKRVTGTFKNCSIGGEGELSSDAHVVSGLLVAATAAAAPLSPVSDGSEGGSTRQGFSRSSPRADRPPESEFTSPPSAVRNFGRRGLQEAWEWGAADDDDHHQVVKDTLTASKGWTVAAEKLESNTTAETQLMTAMSTSSTLTSLPLSNTSSSMSEAALLEQREQQQQQQQQEESDAVVVPGGPSQAGIRCSGSRDMLDMSDSDMSAIMAASLVGQVTPDGDVAVKVEESVRREGWASCSNGNLKDDRSAAVVGGERRGVGGTEWALSCPQIDVAGAGSVGVGVGGEKEEELNDAAWQGETHTQKRWDTHISKFKTLFF